MGVAPGDADISVIVAGVSRGALQIAVSSDAVYVAQLDIAVMSSLTLAPVATPFGRFDASTAVVSISQKLLTQYSQAYVYAVVVYSDGLEEEITLSDGLELHSLNLFVVQVAGQYIIAIGTGHGYYLQAELTSGACSNVSIAHAKYNISITLPVPTSVIVTGVASTLTISGDPVSLLDSAALPTSSLFTVTLIYYSGIPDKDVTTDAGTLFNLSLSNGLFSIQNISGRPTIVANATAGQSGTGIFQVYFTQYAVTTSVSIQIVRSSYVNISTTPSPTYAGSSAVVAHQLAPYANSGVYQQATLVVTLTTSDGAVRTITADTNISYTVRISGTQTVSSNVVMLSGSTVSRNSSGPFGAVDIYAVIHGLASAVPFTLTVVSQPLNLTGLVMQFVRTLEGLVGVQARAAVTAIFSDGSQYAPVFDASVAVVPGINLPNLVFFTTAVPSVAAVNNSTGIVTLYNNYYLALTLTATGVSNESVTTSVSFFANLDPGFGDVDLGAISGLPLDPVSPLAVMSVMVRVNTGGLGAGAVDLTMLYDASRVAVVNGSQGSNWNGGTFIATLNDPPGQVLFGGVSNPIIGTEAVIATIAFKILASAADSILTFNGTVNNLALANGTTIGASTPRSFVAGSVSVVVSGSRRRRESNPATMPPAPSLFLLNKKDRRSSPCASPPCVLCSLTRETGDVNGDCIFNINDVTAAQALMLGFLFNASFGNGLLPFQLINLDADKNGVYTNLDSLFLLRVNFRQIRFLKNVSVTPVAYKTNGCELVISALMLEKGDAVATVGQTFVFFDIESTNSSLRSQFDSSALSLGSDANIIKGSGYNGGLWNAVNMGNGYYAGRVFTSISMNNIGLSLIQVTTDATLSTRGQPHSQRTVAELAQNQGHGGE